MTPIQAVATSSPIMQRLKEETIAIHAATERIPFSRAMMTGRLPLERYVQQLRAYRIVHQAIESAVACDGEFVCDVWRPEMRRTHLIERDLAFLDPSSEVALSTAAMDAAHDMADNMIDASDGDSLRLLGYMYVLEGSTLGGTIIRRHIANAFNLVDDRGIEYLSPYGNDVMLYWRRFTQAMNDCVNSFDEQEHVIDGARAAFRNIGAILIALSVGL